jgi:UDP-galactopyranose mutase
MPEHGYTELIQRILDHQRIAVHLNTLMAKGHGSGYVHVFYSGELDGYFDYKLGRLGYRSLRFEFFHPSREETLDGDYQGCAVMNYCDGSVPHIRVTEHKHFAQWESHDQTICCREYSIERKQADRPYYPIRLAKEDALLRQYVALAEAEKGVTFVGRLGTFRYLDMDVTIQEALETARQFIDLSRREKVHMSFTASARLI